MLSSLINTISMMVLLVGLTCGSVYFGCISINISEWPMLGLELCQNCTNQTFITLVLVVSMIIMWYSNYYMQGELYFSMYSMIMLMFTISMVLLLLSGSWITTLMGWEGLGITSFFLIHTSSSWESVNNAMSTLLTMRLGDLCLFMLMSVVVVGSTMNNPTFGMQSGESTWLIIMAMTKSAQIPFSGWLPKAMSAPTPTSALVHSSTLVTAGLILLMSQSLAVMSVSVLSMLYVVGLVTMAVGSMSTLMESSVKKAVAFSTLSQMGLACMSYGLGEFNVAYWNLVSHGITKSLLFMLVGYSIHGGMNQQAVGKWSGIIMTGLHRLEMLVSLVSLSGSGFFSGMVTKEALLECIQAVGEHIISKSLTAFTVYMTLYYCIVLWSFYSNMSSLSVGVYQNSASMLVLTILHTLWTMYWFSWMGLNVITVPVGFQYTETMAPVIMISGLMLSIPLILWSGFPHYLLQLLGSYIMTLQHYVWAQSLLMNLQFIEGMMNSVVLLGYHTMNLLSVKATWQMSGSSVNLLTLMLVFMLVMM